MSLGPKFRSAPGATRRAPGSCAGWSPPTCPPALPAGLPAAGTASLWAGSVAPPSVAPSAVPPATSLAEPCPGLLADRTHALRLIGTR